MLHPLVILINTFEFKLQFCLIFIVSFKFINEVVVNMLYKYMHTTDYTVCDKFRYKILFKSSKNIKLRICVSIDLTEVQNFMAQYPISWNLSNRIV